jgi:hypothetical protein
MWEFHSIRNPQRANILYSCINYQVYEHFFSTLHCWRSFQCKNHSAAIYTSHDVKATSDLKSVWSCLHAVCIRTKYSWVMGVDAWVRGFDQLEEASEAASHSYAVFERSECTVDSVRPHVSYVKLLNVVSVKEYREIWC